MSTDQTREKLLVRVSEVADVLSLPRSRAYQLVAEGVLPSVRLGRSVRVPLAALKKWVLERSNEPEAR